MLRRVLPVDVTHRLPQDSVAAEIDKSDRITCGRLSQPSTVIRCRSRDGRSEQDRAPYGAWQKLGFITPIGPTTDPRTIANKIAEINGTNKIRALAFDRWRINDLVSSMPSAATFHWDRMARATKT
jgi:hypothetical protein